MINKSIFKSNMKEDSYLATLFYWVDNYMACEVDLRPVEGLFLHERGWVEPPVLLWVVEV